MKFRIAYHPVWEQTLTVAEKKKYEQILSKYSSDNTSTSICTVVVKQKKNGGMVATVLICNGSETELKLTTTRVKVNNKENTSHASAEFTIDVIIPAYSAMPWSFVFKPDDVFGNVIANDEWTVQIFPVE
ncbi:SLAP domain-containing protein [Sporosarcina siberiensis]|uniref:SLAP domain-containing protein n=1 Tax=Sporosarcina siberiensis TaxID=1365606 RepID=A0ABW4SEY1_9BACL